MLFLYNPTAGKGRVTADLAAVLDVFTKAGYLTTVYPTQGKADATRIAAELGGQFDRVVCSGGDGTLSETVSGLMQLDHPPGAGLHPLRLHQRLRHHPAPAPGPGESRPDRLRDRRSPPLGYRQAQRPPLRLCGRFRRLHRGILRHPPGSEKHLRPSGLCDGGIASLPSITPYHLRIECDDQVLEDDFFYGMVCNTISVGGMKALPTDRVVLDDGLFEVILVRKPTSITDLTDSLQALIRQEPPQSGAVLSFHASHLKFTAEKPIPWTLDGEYGGSHEINVVENCRQALTVMQGD